MPKHRLRVVLDVESGGERALLAELLAAAGKRRLADLDSVEDDGAIVLHVAADHDKVGERDAVRSLVRERVQAGPGAFHKVKACFLGSHVCTHGDSHETPCVETFEELRGKAHQGAKL